METQGQSGVSRTVAVVALLVVVCLVLGATTVYYNSTLNQQITDSNSATTKLQNQVSQLQSSLFSLESSMSSSGHSTDSTSTDATALAIYGNASKSVVTIEGDVVTTVNTFFGPVVSYSVVEGSGFVTDYQNTPYIITNFHVVDGTTNMTVTFSNGDAYPGKVVGSDVYADLAVVSVTAPASEFFPLTIVDSSGLTVGQSVYAIGAPFGLSGTFTSGVISQLGRTITEATAGNYSISGIVQFTAPINPGNSGGPLLDSNGDVVGITTATISGSQGLGFAIPSQTILRELPSLITTGSYTDHSYLGVGGVDMSYQLALASKTNITYGVLVEQVTSGGPAAKAGIRAGTKQVDISDTQYLVGGDIIISANGTRLINTDALSSYLEENTVAGQTVILGIVRGGVFMNVTVTLGARPQP
jgi:S1-C subfamily serine protease